MRVNGWELQFVKGCPVGVTHPDWTEYKLAPIDVKKDDVKPNIFVENFQICIDWSSTADPVSVGVGFSCLVGKSEDFLVLCDPISPWFFIICLTEDKFWTIMQTEDEPISFSANYTEINSEEKSNLKKWFNRISNELGEVKESL